MSITNLINDVHFTFFFLSAKVHLCSVIKGHYLSRPLFKFYLSLVSKSKSSLMQTNYIHFWQIFFFICSILLEQFNTFFKWFVIWGLNYESPFIRSTIAILSFIILLAWLRLLSTMCVTYKLMHGVFRPSIFLIFYFQSLSHFIWI